MGYFLSYLVSQKPLNKREMFNQHLKVFWIETFSSNRQTNRQTNNRKLNKQTNRQTDKQSAKQTNNQSDSFIPPSSIKRMCKVPVINISSASAVNPLIDVLPTVLEKTPFSILHRGGENCKKG